MYNNSTYGFNLDADHSSALRTKIVDACRQATGGEGTGTGGETLTAIITSDIIMPVSEYWFTKEGKTYFDGFVNFVNGLSGSIAEAYSSFISSINNTGRVWAENTGNDYVQLQDIDAQDARISVSADAIKEVDAAGSAVIDVEALNSNVVAKLPAIRTRIEEAVRAANSGLAADENFIGGQQAEAIQELFTKLAEVIAKIFDFLVEDTGDHQSLSTAIKTAAEKQKQVAEEVANAYRNSQE